MAEEKDPTATIIDSKEVPTIQALNVVSQKVI